VKWVDQWLVERLSEGDRTKVKAQLLRAHAAFWKSPEASDADTAAMNTAFDGIAHILLDAGLLSEQRLAVDIPELVWDSAIAGGWWRLASETRQAIFPEALGHYWVWRDDSRNWNMLFSPEAAEWRAKLLDAAVEETARSIPSNHPDLQSEADVISERNSPTDTSQDKAKTATVESRRARRLPSTVTSLVAAKRLEEFLERTHLGRTEFAIRVGTTDRTLLSFRKTGRVRRGTFDAIAREMGTTPESLLKP
jgi:hypothetical protein